jgi:ABC-2 type transport system permease protein
MSGFRALLKKELLGTRRTWRRWVLPGVLLFCGLTSPPLAKLLPLVTKATASSSRGAVIILPAATPIDGYAQYIGNLTQLAVLTLLIASGGLVSSEMRSGTGILVLTKPVSRSAFVSAKVVAQLLLLLAATFLATAVCVAMTAAVFGRLGPSGHAVTAAAAWCALAVLLTAAMTYFSTTIRSAAGAAGAGLGLFAGLAILDSVPVLHRLTPAGLTSLPTHVLNSEPTALFWPLASGLALAALFIMLALRSFRRQEI